jgi:hypothetical protein
LRQNGTILEPRSADFAAPAKEKGPDFQGLSPIAGAGFGLMGYVATLVEFGAKTASVLGKRWTAQQA